MKANLQNIQKIYLDIPGTFTFEGIKTDNYKKSKDHYLHGWREVVIPEITEYQRLGEEYVLVNDIITKEVIDFTNEEKTAYNLNKAIAIDLEYKAKITKLLEIPIEKVMCGEYDSIPLDKLEQRELLKAECNDKIIALGITDFTFRKTLTIKK